MKTTSLAVALSITLAVASGALASDQVKEGKETKTPALDKAKKSKPRSPQREAKVELTGSYIKQNIHRNGWITDGVSQVVIIDRATIEGSGASDLKQLLVHQGIH